MPKNYYEQAGNCIYCGSQLDIGALDRNRKVHKYPNCGQRMNFFHSKLDRAMKSENSIISKFAKKWNGHLEKGDVKITQREVDIMLTKVLRAKAYFMIPKAKKAVTC